MKPLFNINHLKYFVAIIAISTLSSCGKDFFKYTPVKDSPTKGTDWARKNVEEGRGVS